MRRRSTGYISYRSTVAHFDCQVKRQSCPQKSYERRKLCRYVNSVKRSISYDIIHIDVLSASLTLTNSSILWEHKLTTSIAIQWIKLGMQASEVFSPILEFDPESTRSLVENPYYICCSIILLHSHCWLGTGVSQFVLAFWVFSYTFFDVNKTVNVAVSQR